jgi:single-strand DNA-binding protein
VKDLNSVHLSGRLTADPSARRSGEGRAVASFRLAVHRDADNADFFNVVCFDRLADSVSKYLSKSRRVIVEGRMAQRDREGDRVEIIATDVHFLEGARRSMDDDGHNGHGQDGHGQDGAGHASPSQASPSQASPSQDGDGHVHGASAPT